MKLSSLLQGLALSLLALSLQACLSPDSVTCASGLLCPPGHSCTADQSSCISNSCGNSVREAGEACDDGNVRDRDGCSADCRSTETCGNGVLDLSVGEICDDGNHVSGDGCSADCKSDETCGNGIVDKGEMCDKGNILPGHHCSADCKSDESCGNGVKDKGEACDDGNQVDGDGCSADCKSDERCGNGIVDVIAGEVCDDGNNRSGDKCSANCKSDERCGNGILDEGEVCDDGNNVNGDRCSADCKSKELCGNGIRDPGEECDGGKLDDLGRAVDTATCTHECRISRCGDGHVNAAAGEKCDDGNADACGTCDATCQNVQTPGPARGSITAAPSGQISSGELFIVSDGTNKVTFVFTKSAGVKSWRYVSPNSRSSTVFIPITQDSTAQQMALLIKDKIKDVGNLKISAEISPSDDKVVALVNIFPQQNYTKGNQPIDWDVHGSDFSANGMSGGIDFCTR